MTTQYNINKYVQGVNGFGLRFCDTNYSVILAANTDTTLTVPSLGAVGGLGKLNVAGSSTQRYIAVFSYGADAEVWVALGSTAAKPVGGSLASVSSELNPSAKEVKAGDVIHMLSGATPVVGVSFYAIED